MSELRGIVGPEGGVVGVLPSTEMRVQDAS